MNLEQNRSAVLAATAELADVPVYLPSNALVTVDFGPHSEAEHLGPKGSFERMVQDADIFIDEQLGWRPFMSGAYRKIAQGDLRTYRKFKDAARNIGKGGPFISRVADAMYASRTAVSCEVDVGAEEPLYSDVKALTPGTLEDGRLPAPEPDNITAETIVSSWIEVSQDWGISTRYRDLLIASRVGPLVSAVIAGNPKLRKKPDVGVLLRLGTQHVGIYEALREASPDPVRVRASFRLGEPIFTERQQLIRGNTLDVLSLEDQKRLCVRGIFSEVILPSFASHFAGSAWSQLNDRDRRKVRLSMSGQMSSDEILALLGTENDPRNAAANKAHNLLMAHVGRSV